MDILVSVIVIVFAVAIVGFNVGRYIYRRLHKLPTGECACCCKGSKKLIKEYKKMHKSN